MKKLSLTAWIFVAIVAAVVLGLAVPSEARWVDKAALMAVTKPVGDIFLRLLKMVVVPLIFASIASGVLGLGLGQGGRGKLGRLGLKTVAYYLTTSTLAIVLGLVLVNLIAPGEGLRLDQHPSLLAGTDHATVAKVSGSGDSGGLAGFLLRMIPDNPIRAMADGNMLAVIFFAVLLGLVSMGLPDAQRSWIRTGLDAIFAAMMRMTQWIIALAPLGIFGLVAFQVARYSSDPKTFTLMFAAVAKFFLVVSAGLLLHALLILPALLRLIGRVPRPYRHLRAMAQALLTAFSTASSNATLPVTLRCVEEEAGVSPGTSGFVLPLGATVNMDGTALYECVVVVFIAQAFHFDLSLGQQVVIVVTALLTSIGVAGVPMASLVAIVVILRTVGMEAYLNGVALILVTDRLLDMLRTAVNVWSDACGAVIIARSEGEKTALVDGVRPDQSRARMMK